ISSEYPKQLRSKSGDSVYWKFFLHHRYNGPHYDIPKYEFNITEGKIIKEQRGDHVRWKFRLSLSNQEDINGLERLDQEIEMHINQLKSLNNFQTNKKTRTTQLRINKCFRYHMIQTDQDENIKNIHRCPFIDLKLVDNFSQLTQLLPQTDKNGNVLI